MASPNDTQFTVARETVPGTTVTNPALKTFAASAGSELSFDANLVTSSVMLANRGLAGAAYLGGSVGGSLNTQAARDSTTDMFLEAALGGTFTSDVLKGGNTDYAHTIQKKFVQNGTANYMVFRGVYVTKFGFKVDPTNFGEFSFEFRGMTKATSTSGIASATYPASTKGAPITGEDVGSVSIGGLNGSYTSLDFSVEQQREPQFVLGSSAAGAINASPTPRLVKLNATMLRSSIDVDALANTVVPVSFSIGKGTGNIYTIACSGMKCSFPTDNSGGASLLVSIELTAINDATNGDVSITRS